MMRLVKVLFVSALIFALLFILAVLGVGFIADFLSLLISAFFSFSHSVSSLISSLGIDSIIAGYWRPALGLIVAISVIVKVVFRGYKEDGYNMGELTVSPCRKAEAGR